MRVAVLVVAFAATASARQDARETARRAIDAGEPREAIAALRGITTASSAEAASELALAQLMAGLADDALATAQRAARDRAGDPAALRALALVHGARHEYDAADRAIADGLAAHAHDSGLLVAKGQLDWARLRASAAIAALIGASRAPGPYLADAQLALGRIYAFKGWEAEGAFPGWHEEVDFRPKAIQAFRAAVAARPTWYAPHVALGTAALREGRAPEAMAAFDAAIARAPHASDAHLGRWRTLLALKRERDAVAGIVAAATSRDARLLDAARQGYRLIGRSAEADALDAKLLAEFDASAGAEAVRLERLDAAAKGRQTAAVIELATAFLAKHPHSARLHEVYDHLIAAYQATPATPVDQLARAVEARIAARPDPAAYFTGATALAARRALLDRVVALARDGERASDLFIRENASSYKLDGKVQASADRGRAAAADLIGWAAFLGGDPAAAESKLQEANRLSRGNDFVNQYHLAEVARSRGELEGAREYYLNAMTLAAGPAPMRDAAKKALADIHSKLGNDAAEFESSLAAQLERRREERRTAMLASMVGKRLPDQALTVFRGRPVNLAAERGNVVLLNFFASW